MNIYGNHRYWQLAKALRHQRCAAGLAATYCVVLIGTVLVALGLVSMAVLAHDVSVGQDRALAASPVLSDGDSSGIRVKMSYASIDDKPVTLMVIDSTSSEGAVPPGIPRLPEPGQAYVSPQLRHELTGTRAEMFGIVVGTIDRASLEAPNERRVYMRPSDQAHLLEAFLPLSHFGASPGDVGATFGTGSLYRAPLAMSMTMIVIAILIPGLVTIGIGVASGSEHIRRSFRMLAGIGFGRRHFLIVDILEHLPFVAVGAFVVSCALLAFMRWDFVLPFLDARYTAHDIRAIAPLAIAMILLGALVALTTIVFIRSVVRARVIRTRGSATRRLATQGVMASLFVFLLVAAVVIPRLIPRSPFKGPLVMLAGLVEATIMWAPVAVLCSWIGACCLVIAARRCSPVLLVAGRFLAQSGVRHSAVVVGVSAVVLIAGLMQLKASTMTGQMTEAQANIDRYGSRVLELNGPTSGELSDDFLHELPAHTQVLGIARVEAENSSTTLLIGSCDGLTRAGFTCPDEGQEVRQPVRDNFAAFVTGSSEPVLIKNADPRTIETASPILLSDNNSNLDRVAVQALASTYIPGTVVNVRSDWVISAAQVMRQAQWCMFACAIGGLGVLYALGVSVTASVRRESQLIAPIGALTGAARLSGAATAVAVGIPILVSGILATLVYNILPLGMQAVINDPYLPNWQPSPLLTAGALSLILLTTIATGARAYRSARIDTLQWRPGK